jgi:hypothetical protein
VKAAAEARSEVTLAIPITLAVVEEGRETGLSASPIGGPHGSPSRSKLEVLGGDAARSKAERPSMGYEIEIVEVSFDGESGDRVEPLTPSQELSLVRSSAGPSSELGATTDLVWPCPVELRKVWFIL